MSIRGVTFFLLVMLSSTNNPKGQKISACRQNYCQEAMLCCFPGKKHVNSIYGNSYRVSWLDFHAVMAEGVKPTSALSIPESWGITHTPLWVITRLLPLFHFVVTISWMCLPPVKSFIIIEDRHFHHHHFVPKGCKDCRQFYLDDAVLVWPWRKLFLNSICFQKQ